MRLRDALKLHTGDEVTLKSTGESCKVDAYVVAYADTFGSKPIAAYFYLQASKQGYITSVKHTEIA